MSSSGIRSEILKSLIQKESVRNCVLYLPSSSSQVWGLSHDFLLILVHLSFSLGAKGHYCIFFLKSDSEKVLNSIHF